MAIKVLSEKVSYEESKDQLKIVILGRIESWKENLLLAWCLAWIFCGAVIGREYFFTDNRDMKLTISIFMVFWIYYLYRIGKVWLFRKGGNELIRIENGELTLKRSIYTYGKTLIFPLENISDFQKVELKKKSMVYAFESGWWVLGNPTLCFKHRGRFVRFAMQIDDSVRDKLYKLMDRQITHYLKSQQ